MRWTAKKKALVVHAVDNGHLRLSDALARYSLSIEEFISWKRGLERRGCVGLYVTKLNRRAA